MSAGYVLGIDLGTTNSVIAYASLTEEEPEVHLLSIPQLVAANTIESRTSLPSFLYLCQQQETESGAYDVPWAGKRNFAVGAAARQLAADMPDRTVGAAKSWLGHSKVDRSQEILPWGAPKGVPKVSPVTASKRYVEHLIAAWENEFPDHPVQEQEVVLTVPASFDASARELTREAALAAGLPEDLVLLEEPQAAVYAWLDQIGDRWRKSLKVDETLLVCDVGGGTTDLTLVSVAEEDGELVLQRQAVGNHLLIGGDNMDLALAHYVAGLFAEQGVKLDPWQSVSLWHSCRTAKEVLLAEDGPDTHPISVLGRGSKLVGGTVTVEVEREKVSKMLADGFFPTCDLDAKPIRQRASGFQEIGLPFESDTAITKHIGSFLNTHQQDDAPTQPTRVLLNGGVFKSELLSDQLLNTMGEWFDEAPTLLDGARDLDHAVARGAAYYGFSKTQGGIRIRGGTARSYYVGIETAGLAIPGVPRPLRALCVVPIGMEEGTERDVESDEIALVVGEPAPFRFFSSSVRKEDQPGDVLPSWDEEELTETDSMEATLSADEGLEDSYVPVQFHSKITELGMFELWCVNTNGKGEWKLEFSVRDDAEDDEE